MSLIRNKSLKNQPTQSDPEPEDRVSGPGQAVGLGLRPVGPTPRRESKKSPQDPATR